MTNRACVCGRLAVPGTSKCSAHTSSGWGSKRDKAARDATYADPSYRAYRRRVLAAKPPCSYPGCATTADTLDHIIPVSLGGGNARGNLRPMCRRHNEDLGRDLGNRMK